MLAVYLMFAQEYETNMSNWTVFCKLEKLLLVSQKIDLSHFFTKNVIFYLKTAFLTFLFGQQLTKYVLNNPMLFAFSFSAPTN